MTADAELRSFVNSIQGFASKGHADKIRIFAWFLEAVLKKPRFGTADVNWCYDTLSIKRTNASQFLSQMENKEFLKDARGFHCEARFLAKYNDLYAEHDITLNIRQMVKDLINQVPDVAEKDFMKEAETCLRHDAGRATIIMVWNVAFYHLCKYILTHKLAEFNQGYQTHYARKWANAKVQTIRTYDEFAVDLKESEVIDICKRTLIVNQNIAKILSEKLDKRNSAAHPSTIHVTQVQAEAFIDDLVRNVVLALPI